MSTEVSQNGTRTPGSVQEKVQPRHLMIFSDDNKLNHKTRMSHFLSICSLPKVREIILCVGRKREVFDLGADGRAMHSSQRRPSDAALRAGELQPSLVLTGSLAG